MDLELAVALSCTNTGCLVQSLDLGVRAEARRRGQFRARRRGQFRARYSEPIVDDGIGVRPGHLVAVDHHTDPPQVVYRWEHIQVERVKGRHVLTRDGHPVDADRLRTEFFPKIRAMYERLETVSALDPKQVVEQGFDRIAERYLEWAQNGETEACDRYTSVLLDELPPGAEVLDLGCGSGVPTTQELARSFKVTGVDVSARQIALARQRVPGAWFIQADMTQLDFPWASFDAVAAYYSVIHVPREEQQELLRNVATWLRPGGLLVVTMGARSAKADYEDDFLGAPMYWSSFDSSTNRRLVEEAGLHIISAREEKEIEFDEPVTFLWITARKPISSPGGNV